MYRYNICKIVHVCANLGIVFGGRGEQRGKVDTPQQREKSGKSQARIQGGGGGGGGGRWSVPPWKITS